MLRMGMTIASCSAEDDVHARATENQRPTFTLHREKVKEDLCVILRAENGCHLQAQRTAALVQHFN